MIPALLQLGLWAITILLYVMLAIVNRQQIKKHWKPGLVLSSTIMAMLIPSVIFGIVHLDRSSIDEGILILLIVGIFIGVIIQILKLGWHMIIFVVGEAEWKKTEWGLDLTDEEKRSPTWRQLVGPFMIGVAAAVVSTVVFYFMDVKEGELMVIIQKFFPTAATAPAIVSVPVTCLFMMAAAISEELSYRGGILAFILRITRKNRLLTWIGILLLNLPWALAHIPNTNHPPAKVAQMMILGVIFTYLAKHRSMRAAIAAHIGLNLAAATIAFVFA